MKTYVLGFLFNEDFTGCVFIRKNKPSWQAGKLNGVGGEVQAGESFHEAMNREFKEETGVDLLERGMQWHHFCTMTDGGWMVVCCVACSQSAFIDAHTTTDEKVEKHTFDTCKKSQTVSNLHWLLEMAADYYLQTKDGVPPFISTVCYNPLAELK